MAAESEGHRSLHRFAVVGTAGSGKTTLARRLALRLGVPHIELDAIHWGPNWQPAEPDQFRQRTRTALRGDAWTTDGNYRAVRDIVWGRAQAVVWLDYSLPVVMGRVIHRTFRRVITREELWNGNREDFRGALFERDGIIWWALSTYKRRRREYPDLFRQPKYTHLEVVRLPAPEAAEVWLQAQPAANELI